jgi:hypothetical protein
MLTALPEVVDNGEEAVPDGTVGMGASGVEDTPTDDPPKLMVGVPASASNAVDAGPALPPPRANAATAAPPINAERMMNFLFEDFALKMLVCGITARETESL